MTRELHAGIEGRSEHLQGGSSNQRRGGTARLAPDESSVSTVLGAILVFGLLVLTLLTVQVKFVPVFDKQREANFSIQIGTQMNSIRSDMGRLVGNSTTGPFSDPLTLTRQTGFSFFTQGLRPATVTFTPSTAAAGIRVVTANPFNIQSSGGRSLAGLGEDYTAPNGLVVGTDLTNVVAISHLRLRMAGPAGTNAATNALSVTDANGKCAGLLVFVASGYGTDTFDRNVELQVYAANNPPPATCPASCPPTCTGMTLINTRDDVVKCLPGPQPSCGSTALYYYVDALDPTLQFTSVLAAAAYPIKLTLAVTNGGMTPSGAITYDTTASGGTIHVGGAGQSLPGGYNNFVGVGTMTVRVPYQQIAQQAFAFEYGAIFVDQPDGSAMLVPPDFAVRTTATQSAIAWSFPALTGGSAAVNGARLAYVGLTSSGSGTFLEGTGRDITFTISTTHEAVWTGYWDQQLRLAGMSGDLLAANAPCAASSGASQYFICSDTTGHTATLTFLGPYGTADTTHTDVFVNFREAAVSVNLQPSG